MHVAEQLNGEIISADSRQVYRGMDLGTGKDLVEYGQTPYHLIDICDPGDAYDLYRYQNDFYTTFNEIRERQKLPVLCGGSSLYISAILNQYELHPAPENPELRARLATASQAELVQRLESLNPALHNTTDLMDRDRLVRAIEIAEVKQLSSETISHPEIKALVIAILWPREERRERIRQRLRQRLEDGMIEEVQQLHKAGISWDKLDYFGLEYRFIAQYLQNHLTYDDMCQKLATAIAKFAKKQDTWLRKLEREGTEIHWIDGGTEQINATMAVIKRYFDVRK